MNDGCWTGSTGGRLDETFPPEFEGEEIEPGSAFRDQFEIDSMDFLNFVIAMHEATGVDIPEADYPDLETLEGCVVYFQKKRQAQIPDREGE